MTGDCALSADAVVAVSDLVAIHEWPYFTGALRRFGERKRGAWAIPDYLAQVALATMDGAGKPWWVQELEYGLGLIDSANTVKPVGARVRDVIAELRARTALEPVPGLIALPPGVVPDLDFAEKWFGRMGADVGPRIVRVPETIER